MDLALSHSRREAPNLGLAGRLVGLGSIFAKTLRDSLFGGAALASLLAGMILVGGWTMMTTYGTPEARADLAAMSASMPPALRGLYGNPVSVDTLGGFLSWHYGSYFAMLGGLWSILALSSTLAAEARGGSLDLLAVTARSRARIAIEKVAAHAVALGGAATIAALAAWVAGTAYRAFDADAISSGAAAGFGIGIFLRSLIAGSIAFALAPVIGRGAAAALAGIVMVGGYVVYSYRSLVAAFDVLGGLTWFGWAGGHIPLAGAWDWGALAVTALVSALLLAVGIAAFTRRDIGVTIALPLPSSPTALVGVRGPVSRAFGDLLPVALAWGAGLGAYGFVMAASAGAVADVIASSPELSRAIRSYLPGIDIATGAGLLQFAFIDLGYLLIGLAAATLVATWTDDEGARRLELPLSAPLSRFRWALSSSLALALALALTTAILAMAIAAGVATLGEDPTRPATGSLVLALYGWALLGLGAAIYGVAGSRWATRLVVGVAILTTLLDLLAPALRLDAWVEGLALTHHLGRPMLGEWDVIGVATSLALATAGSVIGAWGLRRRDLAF